MPGVNRVSVRVVPDTKGFKETVQKFLKRLEATVNLTINLGVDTTAARATIDEFKERVDKEDVTLNADADTGKADHDLKEVSKSRTATVNADADTGKASVKLAYLTRPRTIDIGVKLDSFSLSKVTGQIAGLSGLRSVTNSVNGVNSVLQNLDQTLPKIAAIALGLAAIGSGALSAVGGIATVATSLSSLLALAAPIPGLLAAAGVAGTVFVVAMKAAGTELASLNPLWTKLKTTIQDNFWDKAKKPILDLVKDVFPQLKSGLADVSTSLGAWSGSVAGAFQKAFGSNVLTGLMSKLSTAIQNSTKGTDAFAQSIATLGAFGASYLPAIGAWFSKISIQFNGWIANVTSDGSLKGWVTDAMGALSQLGSVAKSVIGIVGGIDSAAEKAGGGGLSTFASVLGKVSSAIEQPVFQSTLTTLFRGASLAVKGLASALGPIGALFSSIGPILSQVLASSGASVGKFLGQIADALAKPAFQVGLSNFFSGIQAGIAAIGPSLPPLASALGSVGTFAGELATQLGPVLGSAFTALAPVLTAVLDALEPLIPMLGQALISAITAVAPQIVQMVAAIAPLLPQLTTLVIDALPGLVQAITILTPVIGGWLLQIQNTLGPLVQLANFITESQQSLYGLIAPTQLVTDGLNGKFGPALQFVAQLMVNAGGFVRDLGTRFGEMASNVVSAVSQVSSTVATIKSTVENAVSGAAGWLLGTGQDIINGLVAGIKSAIGRVQSVLAGVTKLIPSWKGPASLDKVLLQPAGELVIQGFINGLSNRIPDVKNLLNNVTASIPASVPAFGSDSAAPSTPGADGFSLTVITPDPNPAVAGRIIGTQFLNRIAGAI